LDLLIIWSVATALTHPPAPLSLELPIGSSDFVAEQVGGQDVPWFAASNTNAENALEPPVTTDSGAAELALARHLEAVGAKMYGAYWCPHCHEQKQLFGRAAAQYLPYVECAAENSSQQVNACTKANIRAYPTWVIGGETYLGSQPLNKLADWSGYNGSRTFLHVSKP